MLTHDEICKALNKIALTFPVKKASYFGSYARGTATDSSDLDLLMEFKNSAVSLFMLSAIKNDLEDLLDIPVDVVHAPIPDSSLITIGKTVNVYG